MTPEARRESAHAPSRELAARFEAYSDWRRRLSAGISGLHDWLAQQDLADAQIDLKVQQLLERLHQDKLVVAFVAEFSRGKSELINAIFFADFGQRLLPSSAGRTTMCPTELLYDASRAPSIRLLPIETRLKDATVAEFKNYADEWVTIPLDLSSADRMSEALSRVSQVKRVPVALARKYGLYEDEDFLSALESEGEGAVDIPCWRHARHQFPASAAAAGPRDPRHAGTERDRHRARAHAQPACRTRTRCCSSSPPTRASPRRISRCGTSISPARTRATRAGRLVILNKIDGLWDDLKSDADDRRRDRPPGRARPRSCSAFPTAQVFAVSAQKALLAKVNGDDALLAREPAAGPRGRAVAQAHPGEARHRRRGDAGRGDARSPPACARCSTRGRTASPSS